MESLCSSGHQEPRKAERMKSSSYIYIYDSKSLDVVQSLYFGSKLPRQLAAEI